MSEHQEIPLKNFDPSRLQDGLYLDVRNLWNRIETGAGILADPEEMRQMGEQAIQRIKPIFYKPILTYRQYLARDYHPQAVETIMQNPESDQGKIAKHDALVAEYNDLLQKGLLTPEKALEIVSQALALFPPA